MDWICFIGYFEYFMSLWRIFLLVKNYLCLFFGWILVVVIWFDWFGEMMVGEMALWVVYWLNRGLCVIFWVNIQDSPIKFCIITKSLQIKVCTSYFVVNIKYNIKKSEIKFCAPYFGKTLKFVPKYST